jgi:hypothetical protein
MGILDEAIREHLDLKRRRGADPGELTRQEGEVFGPSRRADAEVDESGHADPGHLADETHETHLHLAEPHDPAPAPAYHPVPQEEPPRPHGDPADALGELTPAPAAEPHPAPAQHVAEPEAPAPPDADALNQPTRAFDPDEVRAATGRTAPPPAEPEHDGEAAEGEDVLDETPEFLAETPEHDRLWFEQRPPRDFDF